MSSYINSPKHFNSIEHKFHLLANSNEFSFPYSVSSILPNCYNKNETLIETMERELTDVIDTLRELNVLCVTLQYKDACAVELQAELKFVKTKTKIKDLTLHGLYNALCCLDYQIELSHLEQTRKLTVKEQSAVQFLKEMRISIAIKLVRSLPEDKTNTWSI